MNSTPSNPPGPHSSQAGPNPNPTPVTPPVLLNAESPPASIIPDRLTIEGAGGAIEALLRRPADLASELTQSNGAKIVRWLVLIALVGFAAYGLVVGSFSGGRQFWAAPIKLILGLATCAIICLPSLYVLSCLSHSKARFSEVARLLLGVLALTALLLVSFAPVAWVFSQSTHSIASMGLIHLAFWMIATLFAAQFLYRGLTRLGAANLGLMRLWMIVFAVVVLQMTTALRPIVGAADTFLPSEKKFFLQHWMDQLR